MLRGAAGHDDGVQPVCDGLPEYAGDAALAAEDAVERVEGTQGRGREQAEEAGKDDGMSETESKAHKRTPPDLLTNDEERQLLKDAEYLWSDLQENRLGGFSDGNRPFFILGEFKRIIEKYGKRDIGQTWTGNELKAFQDAPCAQGTRPPAS